MSKISKSSKQLTSIDSEIIQWVNQILLDAIQNEISDIHFEPSNEQYRIRLRKDGILYEKYNPPNAIAPRIAARLKVMAKLDISECRRPQDGCFKLNIPDEKKSYDFRISTCPTIFGEKIVIRLLNSAKPNLDINTLGYEPFQQDILLEKLHQKHGLILVTGPTGSGKTISLYSALEQLNSSIYNISTIEDPVEIQLRGINQININAKIEFTFANALKTLLRQDPDIIMVGEIRDLETAEITINAAHTGHLVLSTLHTNTAYETLNRLKNLGVLTFNIASSLSLVVAQRLVRKLCLKCRQPTKDFNIYRAIGCSSCYHGYNGRIGIYELLNISESIRNIILQGGNSNELKRQAQTEGFWTLQQSGFNKVKQGLTSLQEIKYI